MPSPTKPTIKPQTMINAVTPWSMVAYRSDRGFLRALSLSKGDT
jgi:hypothetical protein